jgi:protein tyrosine phosphatase
MVMTIQYMQGYKLNSGFIATQGPVPNSIPDFWRMVWEQNTATIVMITNLVEKLWVG